jgi:serine kinase of HPr protein (carbohydrate metabolism regulator)
MQKLSAPVSTRTSATSCSSSAHRIAASRREVTVSDIHRPGMALMGLSRTFLPERIQIIAQTELTYLATLSPGDARGGRLGSSSFRCR